MLEMVHPARRGPKAEVSESARPEVRVVEEKEKPAVVEVPAPVAEERPEAEKEQPEAVSAEVVMGR